MYNMKQCISKITKFDYAIYWLSFTYTYDASISLLFILFHREGKEGVEVMVTLQSSVRGNSAPRYNPLFFRIPF